MTSKALAAWLTLAVAGCSTLQFKQTPITTQSGAPAPASRLYRPELAEPSAGHTAKVTFLRDAGLLLGAFAFYVAVDGVDVVGLRAGEYQVLYLEPGQHQIAVRMGGLSESAPRLESIFLADGADETRRVIPVFSDDGGDLEVARIDPSTGEIRSYFGEPGFTWDRSYATPGTSFTLKELRRGSSSSGSQVEYELHATGFPATESSSLWSKQGDTYAEVLAPIDENGVVSFLGMSKLGIDGYVRGQAVDLALVFEDRRAQASVVPFPIAAKEGELWASVELVSGSGLIFVITFGGFQPGEKVEASSQYDGERLPSAMEASAKGEVALPVLFGPGDSGTATATATGSRGSVSIQYQVGEDALVPE